MRSRDEIINDPQASVEEIQWLEDQGYEIDAISHPNCPADIWWRLAEWNVLHGLASPAGQLFLLESPERWTNLRRIFLGRWISFYRRQHISERQRHLFDADCIEHVAWIYEKEEGPDPALQESIDWRRASSQREPEGWEDQVEEMVDIAEAKSKEGARSVARACLQDSAYNAQRAIENHYNRQWGQARNKEISVLLQAETDWQFERIQEYWRGRR